jgi:hypothetical protein
MAAGIAATGTDQPGTGATGTAAEPEYGPFNLGTDTLEITGVTWIESWNKNLASDRLVGARLVIGSDWYPAWQWIAELELQRVIVGNDRDAFLVGLSGLVRRRVGGIGRTQPFVELGLGAALGTRPTPPRGSSFNFLLQGGGGVVRPFTSAVSLVIGLRLWHLSNGGVIINSRHNPDIEGLGGYAGLQWHFR